MPILLDVHEAVRGLRVRLDVRTWKRHILWEHPELAPRLQDVADTLAQPSMVLASKYRRDTWLYHRLLPDRRRYMSVAVRWRYNEQGEAESGFVVTAFLTARPHGGELIWMEGHLPYR